MLQNFLVSEKCSTFAMYLRDMGALSLTVQKFLQLWQQKLRFKESSHSRRM